MEMLRVNNEHGAPWEHRAVRRTEDMHQVLEPVIAAMAREGYAEADLLGMRLALTEALANAVNHGHQGDPAKLVRVRYQVTASQALVEVEDEGQGFDPGRVPDPLDPENLERPGGRGLLLMRHYLTWVRYNERGNGVALCRRRSVR
jgi:serine/threonine-protein kinase RsbW